MRASLAGRGFEPIAACDEIFHKAEKTYNTMVEAYQRAGKNSDKAITTAEHALNMADVEARKCYGMRAKDQPYFTAVVTYAQELVDRLK